MLGFVLFEEFSCYGKMSYGVKMLNFIKKLRGETSGAVLVEMAFILPMFTFLTLAIFEFAIIFFYSFVLESAMYSVTRFAKVQTSPSAVEQEVRDKIGELSLGLMDPKKVIITTKLDVNFAEDWENAPPEQCSAPNSADTCLTLPDCNGQGFVDVNNNSACDIGSPPLELGVPGAIVSYVAFYKKELLTPGLGLFIIDNNNYLNANPDSSGPAWYLISSATVTRNEPQ